MISKQKDWKSQHGGIEKNLYLKDKTKDITCKVIVCVCVFLCSQKKIQRDLLDMNILLSEKQTVHEQGFFKPQIGMKFIGMILWDSL